MASPKRIWTLSLACAGLLACGQAAAQIAPGPSNAPIDFTQNRLERYPDEHRMVLTGDVEVIQGGARLNCDVLTIYFYGPGEGPKAGPAPAKTAAKSGGTDETSTDSIKQMVAEGHVFYVTQSETVRGDRGIYDAEPDTITMTGNVIVVQGKNVAKGDKMVMDRKSGHTTMISATTGRSNPNRVRGVFYNQNGQGDPAPAAAAKKP